MTDTDLLPFYQQFFTEHLFLVPEAAPVATPAPEVATAVDPDTEVFAGENQLSKMFLVTGENKKGLVLLFSLPEEAFAALPHNVFLTKILAAIQHTPEDVAYINLAHNYAINIFNLSRETKVQQVVAFGSGLIDLVPGTKINLYKPAAIGQSPLLLADPLHLIENDVNRKKLLWIGLQAMFLK
ncbi:MAG: hypothetical protein JWQ14_2108 [Adhaeribacter sp.]|nr:hypothetical protein [Adhaeribacter sp.]